MKRLGRARRSESEAGFVFVARPEASELAPYGSPYNRGWRFALACAAAGLLLGIGAVLLSVLIWTVTLAILLSGGYHA